MLLVKKDHSLRDDNNVKELNSNSMVSLVETNSVVQYKDDGMSCDQKILESLKSRNQSIVSTLADRSMCKMENSTLNVEKSLKEFNFRSIKVYKDTDLKIISKAKYLDMMIPKEHNHGAQDMDHDISMKKKCFKDIRFQTTQSPLTNNVGISRANEVQNAIDQKLLVKLTNTIDDMSQQSDNCNRLVKTRENLICCSDWRNDITLQD